MAAIADFGDYVAAVTGSPVEPQHLWCYKTGRVNGAAAGAPVQGRWTSLWAYEGSGATHGYAATPPTTSAVCTSATDGALEPLVNAGVGNDLWLTGMGWNGGSVYGTLLIYDRLVHQGGLSATVTTAQTTNLPTSALTRYSGTASVGNKIWLEVYTQTGTTATTVSASYTNQAGTSGRTTPLVTFGGTGYRGPQQLIELPYQQGDTGVQSVESVTVTATTGTAGAFGVVIARPLMAVSYMQTGTGEFRDGFTGGSGLIKVLNDACLAFVFMSGGTAVPTPMIDVHIVET